MSLKKLYKFTSRPRLMFGKPWNFLAMLEWGVAASPCLKGTLGNAEVCRVGRAKRNAEGSSAVDGQAGGCGPEF